MPDACPVCGHLDEIRERRIADIEAGMRELRRLAEALDPGVSALEVAAPTRRLELVTGGDDA